MVRKLFVTPMKMYAKMELDKLESILLIYILLCSPAGFFDKIKNPTFNLVSTGLSEEAHLILSKESEKFGKMLLQLQQQRFGQQAGALRYMESQRLIWSAIEGKFCYYKIIPAVEIAVNNGTCPYTRFIYALFEN